MKSDVRATASIPMRTCVGCRSRAEKSELLRVVVDGSGSVSELVPDPGGRLPGRGAYLHPSPGCLDVALRRRALTRALRLRESLDTTEVQRMIDAVDEPDGGSEGRSGKFSARPTGQEEGDST